MILTPRNHPNLSLLAEFSVSIFSIIIGKGDNKDNFFLLVKLTFGAIKIMSK